MNQLNLRARNDTSTLHTFEVAGPEFRVVAHHEAAKTSSVLGVYKSATDAIIKHFQLLAKFNMEPTHG